MKGRPRHTISDIRKSLSPAKARDELYGDWASALIYRPISFWITPAFIALSLSATTVSVLMLVLTLAIPALGVFMGPAAHAAIGIAGFICMVLDCADGNIARVTGTSSDAGAYLDFAIDIVYRVAFYGTLGYVADAELAGPAFLTGHVFSAALLSACVALGARLCRFREGRPLALYLYSPERVAKAGFIGRFVFPALSGSDRILPVLVLATAFWGGGLGWVVLWTLALGIVDLIYTQVVVLERLKEEDKA